MLTFDLKDAYQRMFYEETLKNLQALEEGLMGLEQLSESPDEETISGLFRLAHSVKGSFATVGLEEMVTLSHELENHLSDIQKGRLLPTSDWFSLALKAVDALVTLLRGAVFGFSHEIDVGALTASFKLFDRKTPVKNRIHVHVAFEEGASFLGIKSLMLLKALESAAEVRGSAPSDFDLEDEAFSEGIRFELLSDLTTKGLEALIHKVSEIKSIEVSTPEQPLTPSVEGFKAETLHLDNSVTLGIEKLRQMDYLVERLQMNQLALAAAIKDKAMGEERLEAALMQMETLTEGLKNHLGDLKLLPFSTVLDRLPRMVRDLANTYGVTVQLRQSGERIGLERQTLGLLYDPLMHLIRNAFAHGFKNRKEGLISIDALLHPNHIVISVKDDGVGIDWEKVKRKALQRQMVSEDEGATMSKEAWLDFIFKPNFSTTDETNMVSGRGVGLDVVRENIMLLKGTIEVASEPQKGTLFRIKLPVSQSMSHALLVKIGGFQYAFPLFMVLEALKVPEPMGQVFYWQKKKIPLVSVQGQAHTLLVLSVAEHQVAFMVDEILREEEVLIHPLSHLRPFMEGPLAFSGVAFLKDGTAAYLLETSALLKEHFAQGGVNDEGFDCG